MQKITADLTVKRTGLATQVTGSLKPKGVTNEGVQQLIPQLLQIIMDGVVHMGGTGRIGFLYEPGVGITIDVRGYDVSKLTQTRQKRLEKQIRTIEESSVRTQKDEVLPIVIKIDMDVVT